MKLKSQHGLSQKSFDISRVFKFNYVINTLSKYHFGCNFKSNFILSLTFLLLFTQCSSSSPTPHANMEKPHGFSNYFYLIQVHLFDCKIEHSPPLAIRTPTFSGMIGSFPAGICCSLRSVCENLSLYLNISPLSKLFQSSLGWNGLEVDGWRRGEQEHST